jgi:hypothetical protein
MKNKLKMKKTILISFLIFSLSQLSAQETTTRKDSLKGGLRFERYCFDVLRYDLNIKINPDEKSIVGFNEISFKVLLKKTKLQERI